MVTRRSHLKSRNGCKECRRRKVKCDESRPSCLDCKRRGVLCVYSSSAAIREPRPVRPSRSTTSPDLRSRSDSGSYSLPAIPSIDPLASHLSPLSPLTLKTWASDMELMHHYSTITANTIALRADAQYVWRTVVPEMGYSHPFVTHGLLAVAAVHKAYLVPSQREKYLNVAAYHQTCGLEGFRTALFYIGDENWKPAFCFSTTVVLYVCSLAAQTQKTPTLGTVSEILKLFVLVRGFRNVLLPCQAQLPGTQLAPIANGIWIVDDHDSVSGEDPPLDNCALPQNIFRALRRLSSFFHANLPETKRADYEHAVAELRKAGILIASAGAHPEIGMLLFFPYDVRESIIADIQAVDPYAMVLLSYFAVLMSAMESSFWFMRGWSRQMFVTIDWHLKDNPRLWSMVEWPKEWATKLY